MTREEAIEVLENGEWWEELAEWYMIVHPEHDKLHDAVDMAISALRQQETVTNRNEPLTLDEMRKMDGEPVWIKLFDPDEEFWVLRNEWVDTRNPEPMILFHMRWYSHADDGKTWLAYRQKPEEGMV